MQHSLPTVTWQQPRRQNHRLQSVRLRLNDQAFRKPEHADSASLPMVLFARDNVPTTIGTNIADDGECVVADYPEVVQ